MRLRRLQDAPIYKGTRVILRVDFDVVKNGKIVEEFRIRETLPTLRYLLSKGARILILTKLGHFNLKRSREMSTAVLIPYLEHILKKRVYFLPNFSRLKLFSSSRDKKQIFLFENVRKRKIN